MRTIGEILGITKQNEVLILTLVGICCTVFDASIFTLHTNLHKVWVTRMDPTRFTYTVQLYLKYILSSIVIVRTFTVHLYLAFYIVMLWPAIFEDRAGLLLPWLTVGFVKCLVMAAMSLSTGLYICLAYKFARFCCWQFLLGQVIRHGPSIYMWACILSYYKDLKTKGLKAYPTSSIAFTLSARRRRVRSLGLDSGRLDDALNDRYVITGSELDTLISRLGRYPGHSRSLDSLLTQMSIEAKREELFDATDDLDDDDGLAVSEKAMKSLHVSESYMDRIKQKRRSSEPVNTATTDITKPDEEEQDSEQLPRKHHHHKHHKKHDAAIIASEREIRTVQLNKDTGSPSSSRPKKKESESKLPRRKQQKDKEEKDAYTTYSPRGSSTHNTSTYERNGLKTIDKEQSAKSIGATVATLKAQSTSKAVLVNNKTMVQKSKSQIPKSGNSARSPPMVHGTFKQDGYTLAYLERQKSEVSKRKDVSLIMTPKDINN